VNEILHNIGQGFVTARPLDLLNLALGVAGVWLMTRRSLWAFPVGLAAVSVQGMLFWQVKFYADATLQGFFFVCLAYGWWHWTRHKGAAPELPVTRLGWRARSVGVGAAGAMWLAWGAWQSVYTDAAQPYRDTFIASFSVLGQIWQVRKRLENWAVWTTVNLVAIAAYWSAELAFTAFLYGVFLVLGLSGWREWTRALRTAESKESKGVAT
jgi:nicotinamide mononucleotide transporter